MWASLGSQSGFPCGGHPVDVLSGPKPFYPVALRGKPAGFIAGG